ncbi:MAG: hypothetical protein WHS38_10130 [Thermodesulforhabdaceae bacterium]
MSTNLIMDFIKEIMEDYEKHGQGKPLMEWFREAIKRHIIDISDDEVENILSGIIKGIKAYREEKAKLKEHGSSGIEHPEINEEINLMVESVLDDLESAVKSNE